MNSTNSTQFRTTAATPTTTPDINEKDTSTASESTDLSSSYENSSSAFGSKYDNITDHNIIKKDKSNDTLYFQPRRIYQMEQDLPSRATLVKPFPSNDDTQTEFYNDERQNTTQTNSQSVLANFSEYVPNLNFTDYIKFWQREDLYKNQFPENVEHSSNRIKQQEQQRSQYKETSDQDFKIQEYLQDNDQFKQQSRPESRVSNNLSRYSSSWSTTDEEDIVEEDSENASLKQENPIMFKSAHSQVEPIPLPNMRSLKTPPSALELERRKSSYNFANNSFTAYNNTTSHYHSFKTSTAPMRKKTTSPIATSFDSVSSSLTFIPNNTMSVLTELRMSPDEVKDLISKLPNDYLSLPYSKRKQTIIELVPDRDYKLIMSLIKKFMLTSPTSNLSLNNKRSLTNLNQGRSRHGSIASQFLSTFSPPASSSMANRQQQQLQQRRLLHRNSPDVDIGDTSNDSAGNEGDNEEENLTNIKPDARGRQVLGHLLGRIIGYGAWGVVRECIDLKTGINRAIKIVRFKENLKVKREVIREVSVWEQLKHQCILPLLNYNLDPEYAMYCLTERITDGNFFDLVLSWGTLDNPNINFTDRCKLTIFSVLQVISALNYMHSKSFAHGDVKLENCLVQKVPKEYWKVFLCDFGMSRSFRSNMTDPNNNNSLPDGPQNGYSDSSDAYIEATFASNGKKLRICKKPHNTNMKRSKSNSSIFETTELSKVQKIVTDKESTHDDTPLDIKTTPRQYGPSLTSTMISKNSVTSLCSLTSRISTEHSTRTVELLPTGRILDTTTSYHDHKRRKHSKAIRDTSMATIDPQKEELRSDLSSHIGSLPYASPELLHSDCTSLGPPADVWALGVMLYTMLTGKLPFKDEFEERLRERIRNVNYDKEALQIACNNGEKPNIKQQELIFQTLYDAVDGCLTKDLDKRWTLIDVQSSLEKELERHGGLPS
ncbi:protein kinase NNK1 NDAI_0A00920 [Naumovozyma dairenensis CBS 421]|uniref:Protein kinase domain-containing protein n=1 Tax=Naumovozyma dairenensis (strain ATCC 10597 / BCRC 20456 / CBS 421 / NBRC 0211 / NRRL Y-12639) TaxID=1071378 RepID=G0W362_NAUDC|nr:hypothetical protein NDAI_0A00920 [Naumovozyma dairenensis CBS 421]CCD22250.1 hypothetical protein NDAI_0A00920 [Naumovozyma dairenensis CBS 421]